MRPTLLIATVAFLAGLSVGYLAGSGDASERGSVLSFAATPAQNKPELPAHQTNRARAADLAAIEKLHREDIEATLTQDPSLLMNLWSEDGVNLAVPGPAVVGKRTIQGVYEKFRAEYPGFKVLRFVPEFKEVQIVDGWAFEWGYIETDYKMSSGGDPISARLKFLRIPKRQNDGLWKFGPVCLSQ